MADTTPLSVHEPSGAPKGGIVVIQEAFGVNEHIEDVCRRFAAEGYIAVAPHMFHRTGDPKMGYTIDFKDLMPHMQALNRDTVLTDVDAAISRLADAGISGGRQGIVGFCMGGTVSLVVDTERQLGASVTYYGGGLKEGRFGFPPLIDAAPNLKAPWLGLFGDQDQGIPVDQVEQLRAAAATSGQPTEVVRYPEAGHGFNCDLRESYHRASAKDAWGRTLEWFGTYLKD
jgi:carboxymethylenebutenolidase